MNIIFATSADDLMGGVFSYAYRAANGPAPQAIFVHEDRDDLSYPWWANGLVGLRLFGLSGILEVLAARHAGIALRPKGHAAGLTERFLPGLSGPATEIVPCRSINDEAQVEHLRSLQPDLLVSVGAPIIFKPRVLRIPRIGCINVHNGRLPHYRGHFGTFWEVCNGEARCYTSVHEMVPKVDAGRLLKVDCVESRGLSFYEILLRKKHNAGRLLAEVLRDIEASGGMPPGVEPPSESSLEPSYYGWPTLGDVLRFPRRKVRSPSTTAMSRNGEPPTESIP